MNKRIKPIVATLVTTASLAGFGKEIYSNDFATRSSHKGMPGSQWYETSYSTVIPAPLAYYFTNGATDWTPMTAYGKLSDIQDGWVEQIGPATERGVEFFVRKMSGSDNPCACASSPKAKYNQFTAGQIVQPFYNSFRSGWMRLSVDLKCPTVIGTASDEGIRVALVYDNSNPSHTTGWSAPLHVGMIFGCKWLSALGYGDAGFRHVTESENFDRTHWYRLVCDINLDITTPYSDYKALKLSAYDMGTTQPTLSTPTPSTPIGTSSGYMGYSYAANGGISGIALYSGRATYHTTSSDGTVTADNCPAYDNIRIWWRPNAGTFGDSELFYENDFSTRRVRTFAPAATQADYADVLVETNAETYVFAKGYSTSTQNNTSNLAPGTSGKTTGRDDWQQIAYSSENYGKIYSTGEAGGNVLALILKPSPSAYYARVCHPIGTTIDSQYVKVEADVRIPSQWGNYGNGYWWAALGLSGANDFTTITRFGFGSDSWTNKKKAFPYYMVSGSGFKATGSELKMSTWYRIRMIGNRSAGTYDYEMYELGTQSGTFDRTVPDTPAFSVSGIAFDGTKSISHYTFNGYDLGSTFAEASLLDNVRIWSGTDGANWNLVYQNDFNERVRYGVQTVQEAKILSRDVNRIGLDGWIRRGAGTGDMYIRNAANPYITIESEGSFAHAVHTLKPVKKGKITVRADIRPPSRMTDKADYPGCVYIGGDEYAQGEIGTQAGLRAFTDAAFGCFGFARSGSIEKMDFYNRAVLFVKDGTGEQLDTANADLTNWYRFVANFDLDRKTWRVDVYKQGASQPAADSADGTLVKSFEGLTFVNDDPSGFSAIGIAGGGTTGDRPLEADKRSVLFDNIKITGDDFGMLMLLK